jgi:serine O-acetyltransferase
MEKACRRGATKRSPLENGDTNGKYARLLESVVSALCRPESYEPVFHGAHHEVAMPSIEALGETVALLRTVLFPGFYGHPERKPGTMQFYIGSAIDRIFLLLAEQINRGLCFSCEEEVLDCVICETKARETTLNSSGRFRKYGGCLPPTCAPRTRAIPRRKARARPYSAIPASPLSPTTGSPTSCTASTSPSSPDNNGDGAFDHGIDIHPGARIGESFFIDHGTGVVIGETCIIGNNVRIYQGVTLGAKSFPLDEAGRPIKGIPRHPVVEDDVIIYSGATILGRITIGRGAEIGGNVWLTRDVPPGTRVYQGRDDE